MGMPFGTDWDGVGMGWAWWAWCGVCVAEVCWHLAQVEWTQRAGREAPHRSETLERSSPRLTSLPESRWVPGSFQPSEPENIASDAPRHRDTSDASAGGDANSDLGTALGRSLAGAASMKTRERPRVSR